MKRLHRSQLVAELLAAQFTREPLIVLPQAEHAARVMHMAFELLEPGRRAGAPAASRA